MKPKRLLFLIHRWLGVGMCLLIAIWFGTGIVMMYVDYPMLTELERVANLPVLDVGKVRISPDEAVQMNPPGSRQASIRLSSLANRPVYQFESADGDYKTVFADNGALFTGPSEDDVMAVVKHSGFWSTDALPHYREVIEMDQWTVSQALHRHRPLHKVALGDDAATVLYISSQSGQIVRDTNGKERFWNWIGSTLHWIYPLALRRNQTLWANVVIILSLAGLLTWFTGGIIGFIGLRIRKRYAENKVSPYRGIAKLHHVLGLLCLVLIGTFLFSGLMSMGPWGIFNDGSSIRDQISRYTGGAPGSLKAFSREKWPDFGPVKEISWQQVGGEVLMVLVRTAVDRHIAGPRTANATTLHQQIKKSMTLLLPDDDVVSLEVLNQYDDYYYARHGRYMPLPVYRVKFNDEDATWFHIEVDTGFVRSRHTRLSRLERWLFNGLHSLDFSSLIRMGWLWDVIVIALCIVGFCFSMTSVVMGWRRLTGINSD